MALQLNLIMHAGMNGFLEKNKKVQFRTTIRNQFKALEFALFLLGVHNRMPALFLFYVLFFLFANLCLARYGSIGSSNIFTYRILAI